MSMFVIIDIAEAHNWEPLFDIAGRSRLMAFPLAIPIRKRPTVLQDSREVADTEALRLQKAHPEGRFVVFEATHCTHWLDTPTHVNLAGETMRTERVARLSSVEVEAP